MRIAAIVALVAVAMVPAAPVAAARATDARARVLVALDERDGSVSWRAKPRGIDGGHLDAKFVTGGVVVAEELRCLSGERAYQPGDVSVVAFEAHTGRERWRVADTELSPGVFGRIDPPGAGITTIPVRSAVSGVAHLLDVRTGADRGPISGAPVAASGDLLLVVAPDAFRASASARGIVTALDRHTAAPRWTRNLGANLFSIVADESSVAVAAGPIPDPGTELGNVGGIEVLDPATGARRWAAPLLPAFGIELAGGRVVFQNLDTLRGIDAATGRLAWEVTVDGTLRSPATASGPLVAVRAPANRVHAGDRPAPGLVSAVDPRSGRLRWSRGYRGDELGPGVVATRRAVVVATRGRIVAYGARQGGRLWARGTPRDAHSVVAGAGRVYVSGGCTRSND